MTIEIKTRHLGGKFSLNIGGNNIKLEITDEQKEFLELERQKTHFETLEDYLSSYHAFFLVGGTIERFIEQIKSPKRLEK